MLGHRLQYSVFQIDNSSRIIDNIIQDLKNNFEKKFTQEDSVMIFKLSSSCEIIRFGYAKNDEKDFFIIEKGKLQTLVLIKNYIKVIQ